jgi:hypothetical protein
MELLDKQLKYSLRGEFGKAAELCVVMKQEIANTEDQLAIDTQTAYIKFKQLEEQGLNYIRADFNRGWHEMMGGDLFEGFTLMNKGRNAELWGNKHIGTDKPIWDGSALNGKHILFNCEAGIGDQMLFVRFVKEISERGGKVIVSCDDKSLAGIFSRIPGVSAVVDGKVAPGVYHDYWIPSMAVPQILETTYDDLSGKPYLTATDKYIKKFKPMMQSDKLKVGIRWSSMPSGGVTNTLGDAYLSRKFPSSLMFNAVIQDHVQLYSLQRDDAVDEMPRMSGIVDLSDLILTWEDTAGAIANLDLVISSCTSVAHLSAAMGKPTWIIIPLMAYYTWAMPGNKTAWYDSVTLFRQEVYGSWEAPFEKVKQELKKL